MAERILTSDEIASDVTEFVIPEGTTSIEDWAFWGCTGLTSVTIPSSVKSIGNWAFDDCPNLTIRTQSGSYTESWAKDHEIKVETF